MSDNQDLVPDRQGGEVRMWTIIGSIVGAIIASVITTKILATHYFEIVDGYVKDIELNTKEFVDSMKRKQI